MKELNKPGGAYAVTYLLIDTAKNLVAELNTEGEDKCNSFSKIKLFNGESLYTGRTQSSKDLSEDLTAMQLVSRIIYILTTFL